MIKSKEKACKGSHQDTRGLGCGKLTMHRVLGLGKMCGCYSDFLLNTEAGQLRIKKHALKATAPRIKAEKDLDKAMQDRKIKNGLESLKQSVMIICHKYIRLRDKYLPCISCGAYWNEHFQAGHFYKAELYSNLKYDAHNINGQCRVCNLQKDGNFEGYRKGIIARYGNTRLKSLDDKAHSYRASSFKWDKELLKEERTIYNQLFKELN